MLVVYMDYLRFLVVLNGTNREKYVYSLFPEAKVLCNIFEMGILEIKDSLVFTVLCRDLRALHHCIGLMNHSLCLQIITQYPCAWVILYSCQCILEYTRDGISRSRVNIFVILAEFLILEIMVHLISIRAGQPSLSPSCCAFPGCSCYLFLCLELLNQPLKIIWVAYSFLVMGLCLRYFVSLAKNLVYGIDGISDQ